MTVMGRAPREQQLILLEVARVDSAIARLKRDDVKHPLREKLGEIANAVASNARDLSSIEAQISQAQLRGDALNAESSQLAKDIQRKDDILQAGTGMDSRELLTLQREIAGQRAKLDVLSEEEFTILEELEELESQRAAAGAHRDELNSALIETRGELEDAVADIQAEITKLTAERDALFGSVNEFLQRSYQRASAAGGYAVLGLHPNGTSTGGVELAPEEVRQIKKAEPDAVWISDDYDCIVVLLES